MAGYFRKFVGRVYDGAHEAGEALTNGLFVKLDGEGKVVPAEDSTTTFRCAEKTTLWGLDALVLDVVNVGAEVFMVENNAPVDDASTIDEPNMVIEAGELVRMKRPLHGEQIIVSVDSGVYAAAAVNGAFTVGAGGKIAASA